MLERSKMPAGLIAGVVGAGLLMAGAPWADQPTTVPRTGGILTCEADLDEANTNLGACTEDLGSCTGELTTCTGNLGTCNTDVAAANATLTTCTRDLGTCNTDLGTCEDDLAACEAGAGQLPGDGVTGTPLAYEVCGDGTVADLNTGLMWEQKVEGGDGSCDLTNLHLVDSQCDWFQAKSDWIEAVNAEGYAGHSDWRIPHVKELQGIVDYSTRRPSIHPDFGPTFSAYWSAASLAFNPSMAWFVYFDDGAVVGLGKFVDLRVRAVRSGPCP